MRLVATAALVAVAAVAHAQVAGVGVNEGAITGTGFPATLAEYRFFADAAAQRPAPGVTAYRLNTPLWSDGAEKLRFVFVPAGMQAHAKGEGLIDFPMGSALIKTFAFSQEGRRRLIETRVLLHRAEGWVALPYLWNAQQTEARLAIAGARVQVTTPAGQAISYSVPNKNQCKECHALSGAITPIGPKARNLAPEWLAAFHRAGRLDRVPAVAARLPVWEQRAGATPAAAARGYLDANCGHCHNPAGSASNSGLDLRWEQDDPALIGINKHPVAAGRGAGAFAVDILPGDPDHSILPFRMNSTEGGVAMPELGKSTVDPAGVKAVRDWIAGMPATR
ncbi:SO2930 family diheme c-type cytochrome [Novosphingobium tardum]|uniref:SO2930 family diheme c-type cytochrome n=1 Tax=Novosphingobium tardum TaxID=1538021 RepID=A0ABV8RN53_9SPHN